MKKKTAVETSEVRRRRVVLLLEKDIATPNDVLQAAFMHADGSGAMNTAHIALIRRAVTAGVEGVHLLSQDALAAKMRAATPAPAPAPDKSGIEPDKTAGLKVALRAVLPYLAGTDIGEVRITHFLDSAGAPAIRFKIVRMVEEVQEGLLLS